MNVFKEFQLRANFVTIVDSVFITISTQLLQAPSKNLTKIEFCNQMSTHVSPSLVRFNQDPPRMFNLQNTRYSRHSQLMKTSTTVLRVVTLDKLTSPPQVEKTSAASSPPCRKAVSVEKTKYYALQHYKIPSSHSWFYTK